MGTIKVPAGTFSAPNRCLLAPTRQGGGGFPYRIARDKSTFTAIGYAYWHSQPLGIGGQTYANVLEVNAGYGGHYSWAPGLGLVRQRLKINDVPRTRTLVRSHIVQ